MVLGTSAFSMSCVPRFINQRAQIFPSHPFVILYLQKPFLLSLTSLARINLFQLWLSNLMDAQTCFWIPPTLLDPASTFCMFCFCVWVLLGAPISVVEKTYTELLILLLLLQIIRQLSEDLSKYTLFLFFPRGKNIPVAAEGILGASTFAT